MTELSRSKTTKKPPAIPLRGTTGGDLQRSGQVQKPVLVVYVKPPFVKPPQAGPGW